MPDMSKDLIIETKIFVENKPLVIKITDDSLVIKKKHARSKKSIEINDLWVYLSTSDNIKEPEPEKLKLKEGDRLISLNDLRSFNLISDLSYDDKIKFEKIITDIIKTYE